MLGNSFTTNCFDKFVEIMRSFTILQKNDYLLTSLRINFDIEEDKEETGDVRYKR